MESKKPTAQLEPLEDRLLGQKFIQVFHNLLSTAKIHQENNRLLIECAEQFIATAGQVLQNEDEVTILVSVGGFYLQQEKILFQRTMAGLIRKMQIYFSQRELDGLRLYQNITYTPVKDVIAFAKALNSCAGKENPFQWLNMEMGSGRFPWVELIDPSQTESMESIFAEGANQGSVAGAQEPQPSPAAQNATSTKNSGKKESPERAETQAEAAPSQSPAGEGQSKGREQVQNQKALRTYGHALHSLQDLSSKLSSDHHAGIGKAVHMVQNMIDLIMDDDNMLLCLSTIRDYDDYTFSHSVNVAILSVCLGNRIGLSRNTLSRLGLSGLFHDLGKIDVPKDILNKPGKLLGEELAQLRRHSLNSVRRIIRLRASFDKKASILLPPFEHHLKYNLSGYPKTPRHKPISLLGRIVAIADVYDAITSQRIYRTSFLSPDQALGLMLKGAGTDFDPILLKIFINMLGIYPLGTILQLDQGDMGIVTRPPENTKNSTELWVLLLKEKVKGNYIKCDTINLGKWNPEKGGFNRPVLKSYHPSELGIQPVELVF